MYSYFSNSKRISNFLLYIEAKLFSIVYITIFIYLLLFLILFEYNSRLHISLILSRIPLSERNRKSELFSSLLYSSTRAFF